MKVTALSSYNTPAPADDSDDDDSDDDDSDDDDSDDDDVSIREQSDEASSFPTEPVPTTKTILKFELEKIETRRAMLKTNASPNPIFHRSLHGFEWRWNQKKRRIEELEAENKTINSLLRPHISSSASFSSSSSLLPSNVPSKRATNININNDEDEYGRSMEEDIDYVQLERRSCTREHCFHLKKHTQQQYQ
jgi:hypothetical protein